MSLLQHLQHLCCHRFAKHQPIFFYSQKIKIISHKVILVNTEQLVEDENYDGSFEDTCKIVNTKDLIPSNIQSLRAFLEQLQLPLASAQYDKWFQKYKELCLQKYKVNACAIEYDLSMDKINDLIEEELTLLKNLKGSTLVNQIDKLQ